MRFRDMLIHTRPLALLLGLVLFALGLFLSDGTITLKVVFGAVIWIFFLFGGTNAYNSYYDDDDGPINFIHNPPKIDKGLLIFSVGLKVIGFFLALSLGFDFVLLYVLFALMSVLYSHSFFRLKVTWGMDLVINAVGLGVMTPLAAWALSGNELNLKVIIGCLIGLFYIGTILPLSQIFQYKLEKKTGEKSFTVLVGIPIALFTSIVLFSVGTFLCLFFIMAYDFPLLLFFLYCAIALVVYHHLYQWFKHFKVLDALKQLNQTYKYSAIGGIIFLIGLILI